MIEDQFLLLVNLIDCQKQPQEITCVVSNEEDAFDVLSYLSTEHSQLQAAYLIDKECVNQVTRLPVEAFDGDCFSKPIKRLQKDWRRLLNLPIYSPSTCKGWLLSITQRQLDCYERRIELLERSIQQIELLQRRSETVKDIYRRNLLVHRYQRVLDSNYESLERTKTALEAVKSRVNQLQV